GADRVDFRPVMRLASPSTDASSTGVGRLTPAAPSPKPQQGQGEKTVMIHLSRALTTAAFLTLAASASAQTPAADTPVIAYHGAVLIDGTGAAPRRGTTILVQGERILAIQPDADAMPSSAERVDVSGLHVLPGLIDSHVHIATPPN